MENFEENNTTNLIFERSASIAALAKALLEFHSNITPIGKDGSNPHFRHRYATIANILKSVRPHLTKAGLVVTQMPVEENGLSTLLMHGESGQYIQSTCRMKPTKQDPQGQGSAITYMRRYSLMSILGLEDDDDDGNAASGKNERKQEKPAGEQAKFNLPESKFLDLLVWIEKDGHSVEEARRVTSKKGYKFTKEQDQELQNLEVVNT